MFKIIKRILIKRWAIELRKAIADKTKPNDKPFEGKKNLAGLGGQEFKPYFISWNVLTQQSKSNIRLTIWQKANPTAVKEHLFFEYFGPLEHWCDTNCNGHYYLWSDSMGVYRAFIDPMDIMLWNLTFENGMPTMREIYQMTDNN